MQADDVRKLMNRCGELRKPFLFAVDFKKEHGIFIENPLSQSEVLFKTSLGSNHLFASERVGKVAFSAFPISFETYSRRFEIVMQGLKRGDTYLVNLTVKTPIRTNLTLKEIFARSNAPFSIYVPDAFVCFSPERFVKIENGKISTFPMKGTIDAKIPDAEKLILEDPKESAEHATVVDLLRNDLSMVATDVEVKRYRYVERLQTAFRAILQVSSEIIGSLPANYHSSLGDILFKMLPAGSVSGAPKKSTLEIIRQAEPDERGFYTGIFGYFDGEKLDSGVLIRFISQENKQLYFHSGGGITAKSNPESEYQEVLKKIYLPFE